MANQQDAFVTQPGGGSQDGALIQHKYLLRQKETVGMDKDELDDIDTLLWRSVSFMAVGHFLFGGSVWQFVDKTLDDEKFYQSAGGILLIAAAVIGAILALMGFLANRDIKTKLKRAFEQTHKVKT